MEYRKKHNIKKHDFIDHLLEIRDNPENIGEEEVSDIVLTSQAYLFYLAGNDTSATSICCTLYELALNPDVQEKLRKEVIEAFEENNGQLNYDALKNMKYLHKVFQEALRKHPPAPALGRSALCEHKFANSDISIGEGAKIHIPVSALHYDPKYYPNPDKFDPERFEEEAINSRPSMAFLPFGEGPMMCIGTRFAYNGTKLAIATVIRHFKLEVCEKTCKQFVKDPVLILLAPKDGIYLKITKL